MASTGYDKSPTTSRTGARWVPGEVGIWAFVLTDMVTFGFFFSTFAYEQSQNPAQFAADRETLSTAFGAVNTFVLLTASLCIALAVHALRDAKVATGKRLLLGAGACGTVFIINKAFEWGSKLSDGHTPNDDNFFQLYYLLTGIHLLHVLIAMTVLGYLWRKAGRIKLAPTAHQARYIENGATYWHLVDLLWLVLFALLYLMS
jgi:nitric oxide reductase NorE protein